MCHGINRGLTLSLVGIAINLFTTFLITLVSCLFSSRFIKKLQGRRPHEPTPQHRPQEVAPAYQHLPQEMVHHPAGIVTPSLFLR